MLFLLCSVTIAIRTFGLYKFLAEIRGVLTCHCLIKKLHRKNEDNKDTLEDKVDKIVFNDHSIVIQIMDQ